MRKLLILVPLTFSLLYMNSVDAEGRDNLIEIEKSITVSSYNPTFPDIQLGYATKLAVTEGGVILMDNERIQGNLNAEGLMYIEAVKGEGDIYYVLEKGGYILSILAKERKLVSEDNTEVLIKEVDWLYGRNGLADTEGFKSNLVPQGFLPKTGLGATVEHSEQRTHEVFLYLLAFYLITVKRRLFV